jgi:hypothetical protein
MINNRFVMFVMETALMTVVFIIHPVEDVKEQVSKLFYNVLQVGDSAAYRKCKYQSTQAHSGILPTCC